MEHQAKELKKVESSNGKQHRSGVKCTENTRQKTQGLNLAELIRTERK